MKTENTFYYTQIDQCRIIRNSDDYPGLVVVVEGIDDKKILTIPEEFNWTDMQLLRVVDAMNFAFRQGAEAGMRRKINEIKEALELT